MSEKLMIFFLIKNHFYFFKKKTKGIKLINLLIKLLIDNYIEHNLFKICLKKIN